MLIWLLVCLQEKFFFQEVSDLAPFLKWLFGLLPLSFREFCVLDTNPLSQRWYAKFPHFIHYFFILSMLAIDRQKAWFWLNQTNLGLELLYRKLILHPMGSGAIPKSQLLHFHPALCLWPGEEARVWPKYWGPCALWKNQKLLALTLALIVAAI